MDSDEPDPPAIQIFGATKVLLTFRIEDDKLIAEYDPQDLNEAAQNFVDSVLTLFNAKPTDT